VKHPLSPTKQRDTANISININSTEEFVTDLTDDERDHDKGRTSVRFLGLLLFNFVLFLLVFTDI